MAINLTTPFTLTNAGRLVFSRIHLDEDASTFDVTVQLRSAAAGTPPDSSVATKRFQIRATSGDVVSRNASPIAGGAHEDLLIFTPNGLPSVANAFTNALTAYKVNRATFEAHLLSAGYIAASLTGT